MSKQIKRKITVGLSTKNKAVPKTRPSVFERLGTKATTSISKDGYCHHWAQSGSCPYGKGCKYSATHTLISPSKQRAVVAKTQSVQKRRHAKEPHKRLHPGEHEEWEQWDPDELEDADPDVLEKRRQELQRELELQMKMENKAKKKEKVKKESSPSTESSSSSTESTTTSEESSSSSSSSREARRKKTKKVKAKRTSSTSSEDRTHNKHKLKAKRTSKSGTREKVKKTAIKSLAKPPPKSPSPTKGRKKSETPPVKFKQQSAVVSKKMSTEKSPRPLSRSSGKEKHRTPSPKQSKDREREKEREREREREKEREKEREREREKQKEREREKEKERERARERAKEREREKEKEHSKRKEFNRSPKRDNTRDSRIAKDSKRRDSPESGHSRDRKNSPGKNKNTSSRRDHKSPLKEERRSDKRGDDRDRSRGKDNRIPDKNQGKDKRDSRDRDRVRDRERDRRLTREEREAAREKEREEALARCQERQRERERLKELAKKEEEQRRRDRNRRDDRGLDKPSGDRVERLLPLPEERLPTSHKSYSAERDRNDRRERDRHERSQDRRSNSRKSPERHDRVERDMDKDRSYDRSYDRDRNYERDRDHDRDRDFAAMSSRIRENERRLDDKDFNSPFDRSRHDDRRYLDIDDHYNENPRDDRMALDRGYCDDRRSRRDMWDLRDERVDIDREQLDHRGRYGREDPGMKGRGDWDPEYNDHDWDRNRRQMEWEGRENWDSMDHKQIDEEWRHYNRSMDNWPNDDRRRWNAADWRERERSRPRSVTSHHMDTVNEDSNLDTRRKEPVKEPAPTRTEQPLPPAATAVAAEAPVVAAPPAVESETSRDGSVAPKRPAEEVIESPIEAKKIKAEIPPVLEDDLSEISDDADEILNRVEEIAEPVPEEPPISAQPDTTETISLKDQNTSSASQKSQSPLRSPNKSVIKEESIDEDNMELDFEEISEDELEEESKVKGLGDALGVDWASLVAESRPRPKPMSSAKLRWESHNVLINLGVSVRLAGENTVKDIFKDHAEAEIRQLDEQVKSEPGEKIKKEPTELNVNGMEIKQEIKEIKLEPQLDVEEINISHPIAAIQVADREKQTIRKTLFSNVGPHRRALSARRDLMIRRHLSNLPIDDSYVEAPKRHDPELLKIATQLFERCL